MESTLLSVQTELEKLLEEKFSEYFHVTEQFNDYTNRELTEEEAKKADELLILIQKTFKDMYPTLAFISQRFNQAQNAMTGYKDFIDQMRRLGATEVKEN